MTRVILLGLFLSMAVPIAFSASASAESNPFGALREWLTRSASATDTSGSNSTGGSSTDVVTSVDGSGSQDE